MTQGTQSHSKAVGHTPTPWEVISDRDERCIWSPGHEAQICTVDGNGQSDSELGDNAAFIVQAVNSHDDLVEALRQLRKKAVGLVWQPMGETGDDSDWFQCEMCGARSRGNPFKHADFCPMTLAEAALAKAKGE